MILHRYTVQLSNQATRFLEKLRDERLFRRLSEAINNLSIEPHPNGSIKLKGVSHPIFRMRVGNYRVIYEVRDHELVVIVVEIGDRKDVYR